LTDDFLRHRDQWISNLEAVDNSSEMLLPIIDSASLPAITAINLSDPTRDVEEAVRAPGVNVAGSDPFQTIITSIERLRTGINMQVVTVRLTRKIFTILLSNRVPMELCWVIFEYLVYSEPLRQVLLRGLVDSKETLLAVRLRAVDTFMRDCDCYLSERRKEVSEVTLTKSSFLL